MPIDPAPFKPILGLPPKSVPSSSGSTARASFSDAGFQPAPVCQQLSARKYVCFAIKTNAACVFTVVVRHHRRHLRQRCSRFGGPLPGLTSTLRWNGFPQQPVPGVGKLLIDSNNDGNIDGWCTGTAITQDLVLSAGHCAWDPDVQGWQRKVYFAPEATWDPSDPRKLRAPYGFFASTTMWVPTGWNNNGSNPDFGMDWSVLQFAPNSYGQHVNLTGSWSASWGINYGANASLYLVGYPGQGLWSTRAGYYGQGQYVCDTTFGSNFTPNGSGLKMWVNCPMNQGASGGPWFVQLSNGTWTIGAVTSTCVGNLVVDGAPCWPWSQSLQASYLNTNFGTFWHGIVAALGGSVP